MENEVRRLRHDLRGQLNTAMLCAAVLPLSTDQAEKLQFLDEVIKAADRAVELLDEIALLPPEAFDKAPDATPK